MGGLSRQYKGLSGKEPTASDLGAVQKAGDTMTGNLVMSGAAINEAAYATVASAATCDIGAAASNNVAISGTTTITSFGTANAGITRRCRATGAFLITYNATSLITKNGKNITTKADDCFTMTSLGSGNWIMTQFDPADGRSLANTVNNQTGTTYTLAITDLGNDVTLSNASAITVTIPTAVTFPIGTNIIVRNIGVGTATFVKAAGSTDTVIGNTTLITGGVAILKVMSASSWQIFAGTAVVNMPAVNSVTMSLATSRTEYLWFVQANCTLLGITTRCSALTTAGTFKLQLNGVDIAGLTSIAPATGSTTTTYVSAATNLVQGDVVTIVADGTLNAVTNMTISPIFTVTY